MATHHIICLTIDTDPDGLSGVVTNRNASSFKGLEHLNSFPGQLSEELKQQVPITWFIRIDEQINFFFGNQFYIVQEFDSFWLEVKKLGHELAWHPHIYTRQGEQFLISDDQDRNCESIGKTWEQIKQNKLVFKSFRNGEAWHVPETINLIEQLGIENDSTVIPKISKPTIPTANWMGAPPQPYFPSEDNVSVAGKQRKLLEIPMNTWLTTASYDKAPRYRYMNPAIQTDLFKRSVNTLNIKSLNTDLYVWNFITHPDEIMPERIGDLLYSGSGKDYIENILYFKSVIEGGGATLEFATISNAGKKYRNNLKLNT